MHHAKKDFICSVPKDLNFNNMGKEEKYPLSLLFKYHYINSQQLVDAVIETFWSLILKLVFILFIQIRGGKPSGDAKSQVHIRS